MTDHHSHSDHHSHWGAGGDPAEEVVYDEVTVIASSCVGEWEARISCVRVAGDASRGTGRVLYETFGIDADNLIRPTFEPATAFAAVFRIPNVLALVSSFTAEVCVRACAGTRE